VAAMADGHATGPSAWDGYAAAAVSEATVEALRSGRPVDVALDTRPGLYGRTRSSSVAADRLRGEPDKEEETR